MTPTLVYKGLLDQKQRLGAKKFWKFIDKVYGYLKNMNPGDTVQVFEAVDPKDRKFYILVCYLFFIEISNEFHFSNYYKTLKRNEMERKERTNTALDRLRANDRRNRQRS